MEWISVNHALPDNQVDVLWCDIYMNIEIGYLQNGCNVWVDEGFYNINQYLYWMPLPEPPKK